MAQRLDPAIELLAARADALEAKQKAAEALREVQQMIVLLGSLGVGIAGRPALPACPPKGPNTSLNKGDIKTRLDVLESQVTALQALTPASTYRTIHERYEGPEDFDNTTPGWNLLYTMADIVTEVPLRMLVRGLLTYRSSNSGSLDNGVSLRCKINGDVLGKASEGRPARSGTVNGQIEAVGLSVDLPAGTYSITYEWQVDVRAQALSYLQLRVGDLPALINGLDAIVQEVPPAA